MLNTITDVRSYQAVVIADVDKFTATITNQVATDRYADAAMIEILKWELLALGLEEELCHSSS